MLLMNGASGFISTYAADASGVCSALFELGGMTVIHDASGCNSTYNTHDEPRWYDMDSAVYISAITEMEAIMGDDEKLIGDILSAADEIKPRFIAVAGTPIPMMTGTDFAAIAKLIEKKSKIPTFGFFTNGMHSYLSGAGMAFEKIAQRFTDGEALKTKGLSVNVVGTTPLDFSLCGYTRDVLVWLCENGIEPVSCFGMDGNLDEIKNAGTAHVNLVMSSCGLAAARALQQKFGTPYVVGTPVKGAQADALLKRIIAAADGKKTEPHYSGEKSDTVIIGEAVSAISLAEAVYYKYRKKVNVICPPDTDSALLSDFCVEMQDENHVISLLETAKTVVADPLFKPIVGSGVKFVPYAHEAFSGRIFRKSIPNFLKMDIMQL